MKTWLRSAAAMATVMVLVSGCLKATMDFKVNHDGSGSFEIELIIAQELLSMGSLFQEGDDEALTEEACQELWQGEDAEGTPLEGFSFDAAGFEAKQEVFVSGSNCGMRLRGSWPEGQADLVATLLAESDGITIDRVGSKGWRFEMLLDSIDDADTGGFGSGFIELFGFSFVVTVTLPGQPLAHNADRVDGGCGTSTFHWDLDFFNLPPSLMSEADGADDCGGGGLGTGAIVALVLVGVLVVVAGTALVVRRLRQSSVNASFQEAVDQP